MPTTANTINYYVAADGTLRDGPQGSISQQPRINYGTEYSVTLTFPASTIAEGDQLQVALNRTRTFFSSASATGDAPVAAVAKHDVTANEAAAQAVTLTLSTNTRAMIDQVNGIDHPVRGFFGVHILRGQSFVTLAVADALMMSLESGPDAISPPLPILDYPTRQEMNDAVEAAQNSASAAKTSEDNADASASAAARDAQAAGQSATNADNSATLAESYAVGGTGTRPGEDTDNAKYYLEQLGQHETNARASADEAEAWAEGTHQQVAPYGGENSAKGYATEAAGSASSANTSATHAAGSAGAASRDATAAVTAKNAAETAQGKAETAQGKSEDAQTAAETAQGKAEDAQGAAETAQGKAEDAQDAAETARDAAVTAKDAAQTAEANAAKIAEGTDEEVAPLGLEHSAKGWAEEASERMTVVTIPSATTSYTLQDNKHYQQVPSSVPTYTLPTASFDGLVHEITVLVDFMHVTSCSFVDASGVPVTLQSAISPQIGEAYIFRCYWYGKWRVVPLKIRNAATVSSATGVVEVTDAVAGDALALKMTAPRSVVMNQQVPGMPSDILTWNKQSVTTTIESDYVVVTKNASGVSCGVYKTRTSIWTAGHVYLAFVVVKGVVSRQGVRFQYDGNSDSTSIVLPDTSWQTISKKLTATVNANLFSFYVDTNNNVAVDAVVCYIRQLMLIDLTQYFNGDQTLIDSIQSWDDLVAYDPRFASYVEYNTGTVEGITPTVNVSGKNLFDKTTEITGYINAINNDTRIMGVEYYDTGWRCSDFFPVTPSTEYTLTFSYHTAASAAGMCFYASSSADTVISSKTNAQMGSSGDDVSYTFTTPATCRYIRFSYYQSCNTVQLELGSTATSYEPYHDGGTAQAPTPLFAVGNAADEFEAVSGVTTHKMASVDLGTLTWEYTTAYATPFFFVRNWSNYGKVNNVNMLLPGYIPRPSFWSTSGNDKCVAAGGSQLNVSNIEYTNASAFKASMQGVILYYEANTPTTSQSTPTQISLHAGNNTAMQTDGGRTLAELAMTYENLPIAN